MRAMIMAAGKGKRLRPLTETVPKPLITVHDKPLIVYHLENLKRANIQEIIINVSHLGHKIEEALGNGESFGLTIAYSKESEPLEVGGGILQALPLLGNEPFMVINGDIFTDFPLSNLPQQIQNLGHLVMVPNPSHHPKGDFGLNGNLIIDAKEEKKMTYSGIAILHPKLFEKSPPGILPLAPILKTAIEQKALTGEEYTGLWSDVGTLERLEKLRTDRECLLNSFNAPR